ncbi:hypothetical protein OTSANNIE_0834 [Anaplasma phagocytophilum str. Annie]|nr:hypothetical protein OTSANNIE_0834 [Anaplasma phagocytophilum str. Annie]
MPILDEECIKLSTIYLVGAILRYWLDFALCAMVQAYEPCSALRKSAQNLIFLSCL